MKNNRIDCLLHKLEIVARSLAKKWGQSGAWQDVYSDMCYAYIRKKAKFDGKPQSYIITACKNEAINNHWRGKSICSKPRDNIEIVSIHNLSESIPVQNFFEREIWIKIIVEQLFGILTIREKQVAALMFDGYTEREIARKLSVSQQRVNRIKRGIKNKACRILRNRCHTELNFCINNRRSS